MAETTLTGMAAVDKLIREIVGEDEDEDDRDAGEWAGVTALESLAPDRLDLVDNPASGLPFLVMKRATAGKARGGPAAAGLIVKSSPEQRYTLTCVYQADKPDISTASDGFRDFAPKAALQDAAWGFLKRGAKVGLMHRSGSTAGVGEVVESYLWPADDWETTAVDGSRQVIKRGDWMCGVRWSEPAWRSIKDGTYRGVSMQGNATRRKPTKAELAGLRKSAARPPKCGKCGKRATRPDARFCGKCGRSLVKAVKPSRAAKAQMALAKATAAAAPQVVVRLERELDRARSADPAERGEALGRLAGEFGIGTATRLLSGEVTPAGLGVRVAKASAAREAAKCRTCGGHGRLRHPETGKASRKCPSCAGSGLRSLEGKAKMTAEDGRLFEDAARKARSGGMDAPEGLGTLITLVGADVAMKVMAGAKISAKEFKRAYIAAGRANQAAKPGQEPRIPQTDHVASPADFRRGVLTARQEWPAPASVWPGQGGQQDHYAGAGVSTAAAADRRPLRGPAAAFVTPGLAGSGRLAG